MREIATRSVICVSVSFAILLFGGIADACPCLTRTPGFWGNHPDITEQFLDYPSKPYTVVVCGRKLDTVDTSACSVIQALCVAVGNEGKEEDVPPQVLQLIRSLAAARLNFHASRAEGSFCNKELRMVLDTCDELCESFANGAATLEEIKESDCTKQLDAFNNSPDTFEDVVPPFDKPGPARPEVCRKCRGDSIQITECTQLE